MRNFDLVPSACYMTRSGVTVTLVKSDKKHFLTFISAEMAPYHYDPEDAEHGTLVFGPNYPHPFDLIARLS